MQVHPRTRAGRRHLSDVIAIYCHQCIISIIKHAMDKIEYWFLDAAIRLKIPFNWLSASNVDEMLNRPHHNLSASELLVVLERMFERGDLFLEYMNRYEQRHRTQVPSRSEIEATLSMSHDEWTDQSEHVFYGVTGRGGAPWETLSHPQWDHFHDEGYRIKPYEGEVTASTRGLIEERLALVPYDPFIKAIVPESVRWSILQPWEVTYWKQLPIGYHIEFTYIPLTKAEKLARLTPPDWVRASHQRGHRWYKSYLEPE